MGYFAVRWLLGMWIERKVWHSRFVTDTGKSMGEIREHLPFLAKYTCNSWRTRRSFRPGSSWWEQKLSIRRLDHIESTAKFHTNYMCSIACGMFSLMFHQYNLKHNFFSAFFTHDYLRFTIALKKTSQICNSNSFPIHWLVHCINTFIYRFHRKLQRCKCLCRNRRISTLAFRCSQQILLCQVNIRI